MATNIGTLLLGELQALSTEARRKHPEIKEAAERVIVLMRGIKATDSAQIAAELAKSDEVVGPFVLGCKSGNQRLVAASVQCLQQLVSHQAVSPRSIRATLGTLNAVGHLGTDIQVKVLQMVLPLVTMYDGSVFGETLVEALHLCLALQRSRDLIVNNTAAAILRQVVVAVFDRVVAEDGAHAAGGDHCADSAERDMTRRYAKDAYFVLQDLCLLAAGGDSIFIRVDAVDQGLILDLLESVLANHAAVLARHTAMVQILRERLAPFLVGFFGEKAPFTLAVRCTRIVWLFVRDLHGALAAECEVLLALLARLIDPGAAKPAARRQSISAQHPVALVPSKAAGAGGLPVFYRVLAAEVARLALQDPRLLCGLYAQYDGRGTDGSRVVADLVAAMAKLATEQPELRACNGGGGGGIPAADSTAGAGQGAPPAAADGAADPRAAQLGPHNSSLRAELHRLLDKHDPPSVPETYLVYLALTTVTAVADGLATHTLERCSRTVATAGPDAATGPVLDPARIAGLADDAQAAAAAGLVAGSWPALHAACAFFLAVRLDDALFGQLLGAVRRLAQVCGALGLDEARNAFVLLLCRGCLPQAAVADHERQLQQAPGGAPVPEAGAALPLVTSSLAGVAFGMHARQVECLRAAVGCAQFLGPVLGAMWYPVLVTLQQAEELLYQSQRAQAPDAAGGGSGDSSLSDLQVVRGDCVRLLAFTRVSGADSIAWALRAMCVLGADLSSAPVAAHVAPADEAAMRGMPGVIHRRLSAALSRPTFAIEQLHAFAVRNIGLLVGAEPDSEQAGGAAAWQLVVQHLLETAAHSAAPPAIRTHAGAAAADIVLAAMGVVAQTPEAADDGAGADGAHFAALVRSGDAQVRALAPLLQMMAARSLDVCRLTLDTVHRLLQASGRWIQGAWGVVFDVIHCVFAGAPADARQPGLLVRCAFPCLQLICSDYLEDLPPHCLRRCVESMALFGRQTEDLNIALTAIGQAWALCDFLQGAKAIGGEPPQAELASTALAGGKTAAGIADGWWAEELAGLGSPRTRQVLWVLLLRSLADLGRDRRHEVRLGAIQTLFRTLEMHGASFDAWMWDGALWVAVLPLAADALAERARVFGLIQSGQLADLADPQDAAEMASKSGVVVEDPARLHRRQWDETAATALQGAVRIWAAHPAVWGVGHADQAWQLAWVLTHAFLVGDPGPASVLPDTQCALELDTPTGLVDEPVPADASLRTRDSTVTAIDCAAALVSGGGDGDAADAVRWRVGWRAWLAMGAGVCRVPDGAALALNTDSHGSVVVTQDALCAYLQLCPALVRRLRAARWFSEADCSALLAVVRLALSFVDAPLSGADDAAPTKLQALALDSVMLVAAANDETQPAGDPRLVDLATATVLAISELALLAAAPYALRAEAPPLGEFAVVRRAAAAFSPVARRLDALQGLGGRRPPRPTLVAVGAAALDRLGDLLSAPELPDSALALALRRGVWQDAAVAMGLHLVAPLARRSSGWFVGVVPLAMPRLRDVVGDGEDGRAALAAAWDAAGAVLAAALDGPGLPTGAQIALLDTVAAASLRYVATGGQEQQPAEVAAYWATLVRIVERAAEPTAEPCVLLGADNGGPDNGAADQESEAPGGACGPQALAMAGCRWLFAMSAQTSQGAAVPAWVSAAAVPAMVRRCRAVVDVYADERALVGRSPMPQAQAALVLLVLQGLAQLECQPGALLLQQPRSDRAGSGAARQVLGGGAAHVFAMYESLLGLLTVPDAAILGAVQRCLRRVSAELFG